MENDIVIANDAALEEMKPVHFDDASELCGKEDIDLNKDGLNDIDGDEVFEEAIEAQNPEIDSENSEIIGSNNAQSTRTLEKDGETSNSDTEVQKSDEVFEEAIKTHTREINSENSDGGENTELIGTLENGDEYSVTEVQKLDDVIEEETEAAYSKVNSESSETIGVGNDEFIGTLESGCENLNSASEVQKLVEVIERHNPIVDSYSSKIVDGENNALLGTLEIGGDGSNSSTVDDSFEEAVGAELQTICSQMSETVEVADLELVGNLENHKGNPDLVSENQNFGEVNSVPDSTGGLSDNYPVETRDAEEKLVDADDRLLGETSVNNREIGLKEVPDTISTVGVINNSDDGTEVNMELQNSSQNVISSNALSVKSLISEIMDTLDSDTEEKPMGESLETLKPKLNVFEDKNTDNEGPVHKIVEFKNFIDGKGHISVNQPENGVMDHSIKTEVEGSIEIEGSEAGSVIGSDCNQNVMLNNEQNDVVRKADPVSMSESNGVAMHKGEKEVVSECIDSQKVDSQIFNLKEKNGVAAAEASITAHVEEDSDTTSPPVAKAPENGPEVAPVENIILKNAEQGAGPSTGASSYSNISNVPAQKANPTEISSANIPTQKAKPTEISSSAKSATVSNPAGVGNTTQLLESRQKVAESNENGSKPTVDTPSAKPAPAPAPAPTRPAGLGRAPALAQPAARVPQQPRVNGASAVSQNQLVEDQTNGEAEEYDETREKLQMIRVKFLRLAHRLGQTPHNVVVAQVLYRLGLAEQLRGRSGGRVAAFSFDRASAMAEQLEAAGQEPLDFTCTIMVIGKSGVGKSATINSIFDEVMFGTDAFQSGTKKVQDIVGTVQGIRVRVIDTPGLLPSWSDQRQNEKILHSVRKFISKTPPDIVLYLDRLDMQSRDSGDLPLLRTITDIFGPSIWFNAIVVLTHAASAPPEGPNGTATTYDMFVTQRSHVVQQAIRQAAGDMRLMNPVSLVENHSACRTNRAGQRVLPNGQIWKPHLLLLSFASKILAEANTLLKLQDNPPGRDFPARARSPPLPFLLSSLLQSRPEIRLPSEQFDDIDDDIDESSGSEDEAEYDELPAFKSLTKSQLEKLPKSQKKAYYDELEYREKLLMKKQLKEEKIRRKLMKKMQENLPVDYVENLEEESGNSASVPVLLPDIAIPSSFDSDNPTHRFRSLDSNPWLVRAVLEPNGWDHDVGYDGINVERLFVVKNKVPISFSGHISKDKKDGNLQMEVASTVKHGKGKGTSMGFDMQSVGKDMAYTLRGETKFSNRKTNKASAGFSATLLGDVLTGGIKLEDRLSIGKRGQIVVSGGGICGRGDIAYGGSLEACLRDKEHPLGRFLSTLGVSLMDWHGDLAIGCNSQTQIPVGRYSNLIARFNINNRGSGQVSLRVNSSEHLQIVLIALLPLVKKIIGTD